MSNVRPQMHKLSHLVNAEWLEHSFPPLFEISDAGDTQRLVAGSPSGQSEPFERLALCLEPPYYLLYVLHTPRGEGEPGRYQSAEISPKEFLEFMSRFGSYLANDARFDLWLHSPSENATVVWDRHNQLFAYGPLARFASELRALGFSEGGLPPLGAHQHHYRSECDDKATELLSFTTWRRSALRPEDDQ
jgi:hypothetical protein